MSLITNCSHFGSFWVVCGADYGGTMIHNEPALDTTLKAEHSHSLRLLMETPDIWQFDRWMNRLDHTMLIHWFLHEKIHLRAAGLEVNDCMASASAASADGAMPEDMDTASDPMERSRSQTIHLTPHPPQAIQSPTTTRNNVNLHMFCAWLLAINNINVFNVTSVV